MEKLICKEDKAKIEDFLKRSQQSIDKINEENKMFKETEMYLEYAKWKKQALKDKILFNEEELER